MKKRKWLKSLIIIVSIIAIIIVALGFMFPGLLWTKNLEVKYTNNDLISAKEKIQNLKNGESVSFTSSELTALLNDLDVSNSIKNAGAKINKDDSLELTGTLNLNTILNEYDMTKEDLTKEIGIANMLPDNVNVYLKSKTDSFSINIESLSVQGINIPNNYLSSFNSDNLVTGLLEEVIGTKLEKIQIENEELVVVPK